jgi:hypothetical protein
MSKLNKKISSNLFSGAVRENSDYFTVFERLSAQYQVGGVPT